MWNWLLMRTYPGKIIGPYNHIHQCRSWNSRVKRSPLTQAPTTAVSIQIRKSMKFFFQSGQLRGLFGLFDGWGTSKTSESLPLSCFKTEVSRGPWWWWFSGSPKSMTWVSNAVPGTCSRWVSSKTPRPIFAWFLLWILGGKLVQNNLWRKFTMGESSAFTKFAGMSALQALHISRTLRCYNCQLDITC